MAPSRHQRARRVPPVLLPAALLVVVCCLGPLPHGTATTGDADAAGSARSHHHHHQQQHDDVAWESGAGPQSLLGGLRRLVQSSSRPKGGGAAAQLDPSLAAHPLSGVQVNNHPVLVRLEPLFKAWRYSLEHWQLRRGTSYRGGWRAGRESVGGCGALVLGCWGAVARCWHTDCAGA